MSEDAKHVKKELLDSQARKQADLDIKHNKELLSLEQEADEEKHNALSDLDTRTHQQMQQAVQHKENEFQAAMEEKQTSMSSKEADQLIKNHQRDMEALRESIEIEKEQQRQVSV